jgi:hypothetical protein
MVDEKDPIYFLRPLLVSLRELWFEFYSFCGHIKTLYKNSLRRYGIALGVLCDKEKERYPNIDIETRSRMLSSQKLLTIHQVASLTDLSLLAEIISPLEALCPSKAKVFVDNPDRSHHGGACTTERESTTNRIHLSCEGVLGDQFFKREDWSRNHIP